jgi:tellurite resistance protein TehA-like permease
MMMLSFVWNSLLAQAEPGYEVSYQMGRVAGMLLFLALAVWVGKTMFGGGGSQKKQSRSRRPADDQDDW